MKIIKPEVILRWVSPEPERSIEEAARLCYKSEDAITETSHIDMIRKLVRLRHFAMLEHATASFRFIYDRGVSHEHVRHRLASYAQESTRYCNYGAAKFGREIGVIEPPGLTPPQRIVWLHACSVAENIYMQLLESGCAPQIARAVLPTCLKTEVICTANMQEWRHIFTLRTSSKAHVQIREVMYPALQILHTHCPTIFEDILDGCSESG